MDYKQRDENQIKASEHAHHVLRARPKTKEDEYFERQDRERLAELIRQREIKKRRKRMYCGRDDCGLEGDNERGCVLQEVRHGDIIVDRCPKCGGVWLDPGELEMISIYEKKSENKFVQFLRSLAP